MLKLTRLLSRNTQRLEKGFTLVEILVVVAILGVLSAIATVLYVNVQTRAENASVQANVHTTVQNIQLNSLKGSDADVYTKFDGSAVTPEPSDGSVYYKISKSNSDIQAWTTKPLDPGADPTTDANRSTVNNRYYPTVATGFQFTEVRAAHGIIPAYYYTYNSLTQKYYEGTADPNSTDPITGPTWTGDSTSTTLPAAIVGKSYTFNFTSGGNPPPSFSTSSTLPDGLTLSEDGKLSGTPSKFGNFSFTVKADNGVGSTTNTYALLVQLPATITTTNLPNADYNQPYSTTLTATGFLTPTFTVEGLPAGLTYDRYSGKISGTPAERGTFLISVTATNGAGTTPVSAFGLVVNSSPTINDDNNLGTMIVGQDYTYTVTTTGIPAPTFSATGLPPGITIDQATGEISGKPTGTGGNYDIVVTAVNNHGSDTQTFHVTVKAPPVITTTNVPEANTTDFYTTTIVATGNPAAKFTSTNLPAGLTIDADSGVISGNLSATGTFLFSVKATNEIGSDTGNYALIVKAKPVITTTSLPEGATGDAYSYTVDATGTPAPTFDATGLPNGLSINSATGRISGTPTQFGSFTVKVTATNPIGVDSQSYTLSIKSAPAISTTSLPVALVGDSYNTTIAAIGRPTPTFASTNLPAGLSISSDGTISGTPTVAGTYTVSVTATNSAGTDTKSYALAVRESVKINTASLNSGVKGQPYFVQINAIGTPAPTFDSTGLPNGLSINANTGGISGTPTETGNFTVKITATNSVSNDSKTYTLVIQQVPTITTTNLPGAVTGQAYSFKVIADGAPNPTFTATGFPAGLSIDSDGTISGTPTADGTFIINVKAINSVGSDTQSFGLTVRSAPVITTTVLPTANKGTSYTTTLAATGVPAPTFDATGLPNGLSLDASTGIISGTPTEYGTFTVAVTATNTVTSTSKNLSLTVTAPPVITTVSLPGAVTGTAYSQTVTATGFPQPTFTATNLPTGLVMSGAGVISGTPTADGTFVVSIKATNTIGSDTQSFGLTVRSAPAVTTTNADLPNALKGSAYSYQLQASGVPAPTFSLSSTATGITIDSATGTISGTPTVSGQYNLTITVTNSVGSSSRVLILTINSVPQITTASLSAGVVGQAYTKTVTANGYPAPTFNATGLPAGLSISSAGAISGTPTADGTFVVAIKATNAYGSDTQSFGMIVNSAPAITTTSLPDALKGTSYSYTVTATGTPAPTFTATGLPAGLSIDNGTGLISGTSTASGPFSVVVTATNSVSSASKTLSLTTNAKPVITTASLAVGVVGQAYSQTITATGYPTSLTYSAANLPAGLSISSTTGVISGTPTTTGTFVVTIGATNSVGSDSQSLGIVIRSIPAVTTTTLPDGKTGIAYSQTVSASGSPAPTFDATGLPSGYTINASTGVISGTTSTSGSYSVIVTVTNTVGNTSKTLALRINAVPVFTTTTLPAGVVGQTYSATIAATGDPTPTIAVSAGSSLPAGLTMTSAGVISGTPTTTGTPVFNIDAVNSGGTTTASFSIVIRQTPAITTTVLPDATYNVAYSSTVTATGTPAPTFTATGLPSGLSINNSTGAVTGTTTATGSFSVVVTATNVVNSDTKTLTLAVDRDPAITTTSLATGDQNQAYSQTVTATGYPTPTFSASGLPAGLSLNASTGVISGTPTAGGSSTVTVTATNTYGGTNHTNSQNFGLVIRDATPSTPSVPSSISASNYNSNYNGYPAFDTTSGTTVSWPAVTCNNNGAAQYYLREFYHNGTYYDSGYNNSGWTTATSLDISGWMDSTNGQGAAEDFGVTAACYNSTGTSGWNGWRDFGTSNSSSQSAVVIAIRAPTASVAMANNGYNYINWNATTCANNTTPYYSVWQDYDNGGWDGGRYPINNTTGLNGNVYGSTVGGYQHVILLSYCNRNGKNSSSSTIGSEGWNYYGVYVTGANISTPVDTKSYVTSYVYYAATPGISGCTLYNYGSGYNWGTSGNTCVFWGYTRTDGNYYPTMRGYISSGQSADYYYNTGMVQNYYQYAHYGDATNWQTGGTNLNYGGAITFVGSPAYNNGSIKFVTAANSTYGIRTSCPNSYYGWCGYENYYVTNGAPNTGYNVTVALSGTTGGTGGCGSTYTSTTKKAYIACWFLGTNSDGWTTVTQNSTASQWYILSTHLTTDGNGNATIVIGADNMSTTGEHEWEVSDLKVTR